MSHSDINESCPRLVSFDGDGTLWDTDLVIRFALERAVHVLEEALPDLVEHDAAVEQLSEVHRRELTTARERTAWLRLPALERIRERSFVEMLRDIGVIDEALARRAYDVFIEHRWQPRVIFPDVVDTLTRLREKYTLGWTTDGRARPGSCGLAELFDVVVTAGQYGVEKRFGNLFISLAEASGFALHEIAHVGDSIIDDIRGAQIVGVRSIWLNRTGAVNEATIRPTVEIASLRQLPEALQAMCGRGTGDTIP